jgi:hypothetical protein
MSHERTNSDSNTIVKIEEKNRTSLASLIDNINLNSLNNFYHRDESLFKKRIDQLNLKFYLETEKYLNNTQDMEKCQDQLFIILFKQISLYIEEIERLNNLLKEKNDSTKTAKEKIEEWNKKEKEKLHNLHTIKNLKNNVKQLENRVNVMTVNEAKLKAEIENLNRQIIFYGEKLKMDLLLKKEKEKEANVKKIESLKTKMASPVLNETSDNMNTSVNNSTNLSNNNSRKETTDAENLNISKIINKKRNYSDNNPNPPTISNIPMTKKRHENNNTNNNKEPSMEVNNININFNVHLKNSNNASINLNHPLNSVMENKRETTKSTNLPHNAKTISQIDIKSPVKTKSTLTEHMVKKKVAISDSKNVSIFI